MSKVLKKTPAQEASEIEGDLKANSPDSATTQEVMQELADQQDSGNEGEVLQEAKLPGNERLATAINGVREKLGLGQHSEADDGLAAILGLLAAGEYDDEDDEDDDIGETL